MERKRLLKLKSQTGVGVLLSIEQKYVDKIKNGTKRYEYRQKGFSKKFDIGFVSVSKSDKSVSVVFKVGNIIHGFPEKLWERTKAYAGWSKRSFDNYFEKNIKQNKEGHAIEIEKVYCCDPFDPRKELEETPNKGHVYVDKVNINEALSKVVMRECPRRD